MKLLQKLTSILLILSLSFMIAATQVMAEENEKAFDFLSDKNAVDAENLINFKPYRLINKAELTKLLTLADSITREDAENCIKDHAKRNWRTIYFKDVRKEVWYAPYVCVAKETDLLEERGNYFKPSNSISWFEGVKYVTKMMELLNRQSVYNPRMSSSEAMNFLNELGLEIESPFTEMKRMDFARLLYAVMGDEKRASDTIKLSEFELTEEIVSESEETDKETDEKEEEKQEEMTEEEKAREATRQRIIKYHIPGTGGGGGGGSSTPPATTQPVQPVQPQPQSACGNGILDSGEQCDDGNTVTEACDYGTESCMVCGSNCQTFAQKASYCGDNIVDTANGEECDGSTNCNADCTFIPVFEHNPVLPTSNSRAMWVWSQWTTLENSLPQQQAFINNLKTPHSNSAYAVDRIFMASGGSFNAQNPVDVQSMQDFIILAGQNGIKVEYLTGDPAWLQTGQTANAVERCQKIISFNQSTPSTDDDFTGIHFDLEPHALAEWNQNNGQGNDAYNDELQANLLQILSDCKQLILENEQNLSLSADIPNWYVSVVSDLWNPLTASNSPVDYLTIMNYTDAESNFTERVEVNLNGSGNMPLMFGANTAESSVPETTFYEEGYLSMEAVFSATKTLFGSHANFVGLAVHYYDAYIDMIDK